MKESIRISDSLDVEGAILKVKHTSARMVGEVTIEEIDPLGRVVFSSTEYNDLTIGGATFILEQMFKKKSKNTRFRLSGLSAYNKDVGWVDESSDVNDDYIKNEKIFGFMIGIGGEDGTAVRSPDFVTTQLDQFIPFRLHSNTNTIVESKRPLYTLARNTTIGGNQYTGYYVKKFSNTLNNDAGNEIEIVPEYTDGSGTVTADNLNSTDSPIYTYAKTIMEIDTEDVREYFRAKDGVVNNARINQLGLVAGYEVIKPDGSVDYDDVKLVTVVNFKGRDLSNDENTYRFRYKIYCM